MLSHKGGPHPVRRLVDLIGQPIGAPTKLRPVPTRGRLSSTIDAGFCGRTRPISRAALLSVPQPIRICLVLVNLPIRPSHDSASSNRLPDRCWAAPRQASSFPGTRIGPQARYRHSQKLSHLFTTRPRQPSTVNRQPSTNENPLKAIRKLRLRHPPSGVGGKDP